MSDAPTPAPSEPSQPNGGVPIPSDRRPPGWYPDPGGGGQPRWWDGQRWGMPPAGPPGGMAYPPIGYQLPNLDEEAKSGQRARAALYVGVAGYAANLVAQAFLVPAIFESYDQLTRPRPRGSTVDPTAGLGNTYYIANGVSQLASIVILAVGVIFLIWFHRAVTNAKNVGIPQRRSPGWAVGGWFIPIGNFFLPYQSAVDLFPPGSPDRKLVTRWWGFWLGAQLGAFTLFVAGAAGPAASVAVALVLAVLYLFAANAARAMIARAAEVHTEMAQVLGMPTTAGYGIVGPAGPAPTVPGSYPPQPPTAMPPARPPGPPPDPWHRS